MKSVTPPVPPLIVAVYVVEGVNSVVGVSVADDVALTYTTLDGITLPEESLRKKDVAVMLEAVIASLKVTLTGVPKLAPV